MRNILALLSLCALPLCASVRDHFKPALNKGVHHGMRGIDCIYVLNLDQRPEKWADSQAQLEAYGIHPYRFSAVNGWELPLSVINDVGVKYDPGMRQNLWGTWYPLDRNGEPQHEVMHVTGRNYFCHCMSRGAVAIVLSHLSILQDAYDSGYNTIWVMEDDIEVCQDPRILSDLIAQLDQRVGVNGWDVLFTDRDTKNREGVNIPCTGYAHRPNFTPDNPSRFARREMLPPFKKIGARYGAYSMIVRRSGMKKLLDFIKTYKIFLPYDMDFMLPNDMRLYAVLDDVVSTHPIAPSDNGGPNYLPPR
jgi:GR25 family glycosyltransferase involved in LPS biosynthesis